MDLENNLKYNKLSPLLDDIRPPALSGIMLIEARAGASVCNSIAEAINLQIELKLDLLWRDNNFHYLIKDLTTSSNVLTAYFKEWGDLG